MNCPPVENSDGETVYLSVSKTGMVLKTEQKNGWVRVNYYDADAWKYRCLDLATQLDAKEAEK